MRSAPTRARTDEEEDFLCQRLDLSNHSRSTLAFEFLALLCCVNAFVACFNFKNFACACNVLAHLCEIKMKLEES